MSGRDPYGTDRHLDLSCGENAMAHDVEIILVCSSASAKDVRNLRNLPVETRTSFVKAEINQINCMIPKTVTGVTVVFVYLQLFFHV